MRQEVEQRHQAELDKQRLATEDKNNCQSPDGLVTTSHSFIYNQEEVVINTDTQKTPITEEWSKPEDVENIASFLAACESRDMLRELRECDIPPPAFKQACKHLQATKRKQIKQWVLELNEIV